MVRRQTRRRRMRGGLNIFKGLALVLSVVLLGTKPPPTEAVSLREAYTWLNKHHTEEEHKQVASLVLEEAGKYQVPSLSGFDIETISGALDWYQEAADVALVPGETYILTGNPGTLDIKSGDTVLLHRIVPSTDEDGEPGFYEVSRLSDVSDAANEGRTYDIPTEGVELKPVRKGGNRRKTLRRRK